MDELTVTVKLTKKGRVKQVFVNGREVTECVDLGTAYDRGTGWEIYEDIYIAQFQPQ